MKQNSPSHPTTMIPDTMSSGTLEVFMRAAFAYGVLGGSLAMTWDMSLTGLKWLRIGIGTDVP